MGLKISETPFHQRMFDLFDKDKDNLISLSEFLSGMAVLINGTEEERLYLTFKAFDFNGNEIIDIAELKSIFKQAWLTGLFQLVAEDDFGDLKTGEREQTSKEMDDYADELATKFAEKAFATLDVDHSGGLTFDEFKSFAQQSPKITTQVNGMSKEIAITLMHSASDKLIRSLVHT